jgi:hypothetical protein
MITYPATHSPNISNQLRVSAVPKNKAIPTTKHRFYKTKTGLCIPVLDEDLYPDSVGLQNHH